MLGLAEYSEPRVFFIQEVTPASVCCSFYSTAEKQKKSQD